MPLAGSIRGQLQSSLQINFLEFMNKINKEILEHYKEIDFSLWEKLINLYCDKLRSLKKDNSKKIWVLQLYATYLQLIEIFCINIFAITENNLWDNIFLSNKDLKAKIGKQFSSSFIIYLIENWVFGIKEKEEINDLEKKRKYYRTMLKESTSDYIKDYELLNAYKHGFRIRSTGRKEVSIRAEKANAKSFKIGGYNSNISYLKRKWHKEAKEHVISEQNISFNWERIVQKAFFLLNMMENTQKILLSNQKETRINTLAILNKEEFSKHFGAARFSTPILVKKTKSKSTNKLNI